MHRARWRCACRGKVRRLVASYLDRGPDLVVTLQRVGGLHDVPHTVRGANAPTLPARCRGGSRACRPRNVLDLRIHSERGEYYLRRLWVPSSGVERPRARIPGTVLTRAPVVRKQQLLRHATEAWPPVAGLRSRTNCTTRSGQCSH